MEVVTGQLIRRSRTTGVVRRKIALRKFPVTLGRRELPCKDKKSISRKHISIDRIGNSAFTITSLGKNPPIVNGHVLLKNETTSLYDGHTIQLIEGDFTYVFEEVIPSSPRNPVGVSVHEQLIQSNSEYVKTHFDFDINDYNMKPKHRRQRIKQEPIPEVEKIMLRDGDELDVDADFLVSGPRRKKKLESVYDNLEYMFSEEEAEDIESDDDYRPEDNDIEPIKSPEVECPTLIIEPMAGDENGQYLGHVLQSCFDFQLIHDFRIEVVCEDSVSVPSFLNMVTVTRNSIVDRLRSSVEMCIFAIGTSRFSDCNVSFDPSIVKDPTFVNENNISYVLYLDAEVEEVQIKKIYYRTIDQFLNAQGCKLVFNDTHEVTDVVKMTDVEKVQRERQLSLKSMRVLQEAAFDFEESDEEEDVMEHVEEKRVASTTPIDACSNIALRLLHSDNKEYTELIRYKTPLFLVFDLPSAEKYPEWAGTRFVKVSDFHVGFLFRKPIKLAEFDESIFNIFMSECLPIQEELFANLGRLKVGIRFDLEELPVIEALTVDFKHLQGEGSSLVYKSYTCGSFIETTYLHREFSVYENLERILTRADYYRRLAKEAPLICCVCGMKCDSVSHVSQCTGVV
ncbi:hypothetical protein PCE1_003792 [Barthelona sp. PCE]